MKLSNAGFRLRLSCLVSCILSFSGGLVFVSLLRLASCILCHFSEKFWEGGETSFVCAIPGVEISFKKFVLGR
jgi:hypothetical protein